MMQHNQKYHTALYAVGGFVIGASAVAILLSATNANDNDGSSSLRASNQPLIQGSKESPAPSLTPSVAPTIRLHQDTNPVERNITLPDSENEQIASNSTIITSNDFGTESMLNFDMIPSPFPTTLPPSIASTYRPTCETNNPTHLPTYFPTMDNFPTDVPTSIEDSSKTFIQVRSQNEVGFRLKLYWEDGYYWQEKWEEKWWCMSCVDSSGSPNCQKGSKMQLNNCKIKSDLDATFSVTSYGDEGCQLRVSNTDLCLQKMGNRRAIILRPCNSNQLLQRFVDFQTNGEKFDLRPFGHTDRCLSNHHHPKSNETIYAETCKKAHKVDTGYWVAY